TAGACFRYLPSAGLVRVGGGAPGKSFDTGTFFGGGVVSRGPVFLEGGRLETVLRTSLQFPAFDLGDPTMLSLYAARENSRAIAEGGASPPPAYVVFATGQMPFHALARFDVSRWEYANYSTFDEGVFA